MDETRKVLEDKKNKQKCKKQNQKTLFVYIGISYPQ